LIDEIDVPCIDMWGNIAENQSVFIPFKNPCEVCKCVNNLKTKCVTVICDEHIPTVSLPTSLILIVYIYYGPSQRHMYYGRGLVAG